MVADFYLAIEEEVKKTNLASIGVAPTITAMSACKPYLREVVAQFGRETVGLVAAACEVLKTLWPDDGAPKVISELAKRLAESPDRILEL